MNSSFGLPFLAVSAAIVLTSCSPSTERNPGLRHNAEYKSVDPVYAQGDGTYLFSSTIYVFSDRGVSVSYVISKHGDIFRRILDGTYWASCDSRLRSLGGAAVGGHPKGAVLAKGDDVSTTCTVVLGPGDRMPVLENAPYRVEGTSVYIDWSGHHSPYFDVSGCNAGSEVMTVKNNGLILESATAPGFILTLNVPMNSDDSQK